MKHSRPTATPALALGVGVTLAAGAAAFLGSKLRQGRAPDDAPARAGRHRSGRYALVGRTVTIARPRAELFGYWRNFSNLPECMENVEKVEQTTAGTWCWTIRAPRGTVEVETEIAAEAENELIAWRSVEGSEIATQGQVSFEDAPGDRGTRVTLEIAYDPPAGAAGRVIAKLFRREPAIQARHDLKRFKMLMETGEIATSERRRAGTNQKQENG